MAAKEHLPILTLQELEEVDRQILAVSQAYVSRYLGTPLVERYLEFKATTEERSAWAKLGGVLQRLGMASAEIEESELLALHSDS